MLPQPSVCRRSAVVTLDSRRIRGNECGERTRGHRVGDTGSVSVEISAEIAVADAKEKLRQLTLQTLKYSTLWLIVRVSVGSAPGLAGVRFKNP